MFQTHIFAWHRVKSDAARLGENENCIVSYPRPKQGKDLEKLEFSKSVGYFPSSNQ